MTTSISPAAGAGALFTQQGVGSTPGYAALDDRRSNSGSLQEGVYGSSTLITAGGVASTPNADFMVTQRGAGANQSVDINMPSGGFAFVQGDTISGQGLYCVPVHSATINEAIAAADATNPRIDQVILEIQDNVLDASGGNQARTRVLTGTATAGATLSNRFGAATLPGSALLLADVLVPNGSSTVPNSNVRDRRKWSRGAYKSMSGDNSGDITNTSSIIAIAQTTFRIECSGVPMRMLASGVAFNTVAGDGVQFAVMVDGTGIGTAATQVKSGTAGEQDSFALSLGFVPTAGSHSLALGIAAITGGTATLINSSSINFAVTFEEELRANTANNTVTTG